MFVVWVRPSGGGWLRNDFHFHAALRTDTQHMTGAFSQHAVHFGTEGVQNGKRNKSLDGTGKAAAMDTICPPACQKALTQRQCQGYILMDLIARRNDILQILHWESDHSREPHTGDNRRRECEWCPCRFHELPPPCPGLPQRPEPGRLVVGMIAADLRAARSGEVSCRGASKGCGKACIQSALFRGVKDQVRCGHGICLPVCQIASGSEANR